MARTDRAHVLAVISFAFCRCHVWAAIEPLLASEALHIQAHGDPGLELAWHTAILACWHGSHGKVGPACTGPEHCLGQRRAYLVSSSTE